MNDLLRTSKQAVDNAFRPPQTFPPSLPCLNAACLELADNARDMEQRIMSLQLLVVELLAKNQRLRENS